MTSASFAVENGSGLRNNGRRAIGRGTREFKDSVTGNSTEDDEILSSNSGGTNAKEVELR